MNSSWASHRKAIYMGLMVFALTVVSIFIFSKYLYKAPNCFDGSQNGNETGVDCGGGCALICKDEVKKPIVKWDPRLFEVLSGVWSAIVYVENPNMDVDATYVPYSFSIYDSENNLLVERKGATILPKNRTVGIFEGSINLGSDKRPRRAVFELGKDIGWQKNVAIGEKIDVTYSPLSRLETTPRIEANVKNKTTDVIENIELVAAIFDGADNTIAASRTFIDSLKKNEDADVFFTWPRPFDLGSKICEKPSDIMLFLDRSGSMASLGQNPPEPLTHAKDAAISFVGQLGLKDKVGVVSFADSVQNPIDLSLTTDIELAKNKIQSVNVNTNGAQYTNVYDSLHAAWQELVSARSENKSSRLIILLTDGVANNPRDPKGRTEADDIKYAEGLALKEAADIKKDGVNIYTIGLGDKTNEYFLKDIASKEDNYFKAPTTSDLEKIYKNISSDICKELPTRIEITYKIFGPSI